MVLGRNILGGSMNIGEIFISSCIFGALVSVVVVLCKILSKMEERYDGGKIRKNIRNIKGKHI